MIVWRTGLCSIVYHSRILVGPVLTGELETVGLGLGFCVLSGLRLVWLYLVVFCCLFIVFLVVVIYL